MVLAVAAPNKRRRLDSFGSGTDDDDDAIDAPSRSPSPPPGATHITNMMASYAHPYSSHNGTEAPSDDAADVSMASSSSTKHQCDICSKIFARHEHMLRHRASHTDTASFSCEDCGKRFRRSDVLQRHRRLHVTRKELSLDANNSKLSKRQRSALARVEAACLRCSSKKLKCDAAKPACSRCLRIPDVSCVYPTPEDHSPGSSKSRNRSASVMDDPWMPDSDHVTLADTSKELSPIPISTPYPAQSHGHSPADFSATGSSIGSSAPLAALASPHDPTSYHTQNSHLQSQHFSSSMPNPSGIDLTSEHLLPASTHFPLSSSIETPRSFASNAASSFQSSSMDPQIIRATPSLTQMTHTPAPPLDSSGLTNDRTLTDLLGWLDGPLHQQSYSNNPGKIDWIFGDSPEAPQLLDWAQMQDWPGFDMPPRTDASMASGGLHPNSAAFQHPTPQHRQHQMQQPITSHQRQSSISGPIQHNSPLFVLSSAAEMIDFNHRTPQIKAQQLSSSEQATLSDMRSPRPSGGGPIDAKTPSGNRSRWNSPEPADDDMATSDSAKSEPPSRRDEEPGNDDGNAPSNGLRPARSFRSSSKRTAAAIQAWPNRWNPAIKEILLPSFAFTRASEEHLMSEDLAHVKRVSEAAMKRMLEHLRNAASAPLEQERFDKAFATLDAATLNIYLQLFFHHCYSYLPAIHQVTFHPDRCDPRLLSALCAIGAFFSEVPGSRNAAIYLASLTQMSVARATFSNHAHARVTSTFQSILLVYMVWRSVGVPSRQEYAEAFRSTYITMIRRARLLENIPPPRLPAEATIDERWTAWIAWESGRRTAWSTLVSETELSVHWNLPAPFAPDELTGKLSCDDRLWEAPSAIEWAQTAKMLSPLHRSIAGDRDRLPSIIAEDADNSFTWPDSSTQLDVPKACDIIQRTAQQLPPGHPQSVTEQERESLSRLSPFSRLCVGSAVMLSTHHTMKMVRFCSMLLGDEEQARERMRVYLAAATDLLSTNQARDARVDLLLHAVQLFELVSPEMLQLLLCRRGVPRMHVARRQLATELNETKPWKTASIVFHAGQMLRLAKQSLQRAPVECLHIFYAAIALQAVSLLVLQQDAHAPPGQIVRIAFNGPARSAAPQASSSDSGTTRIWRADSSASLSSSTSPSSVSGATYSTGGTSSADAGTTANGKSVKTTFMLESVGNLAHPMAPEKVLSLASKWLRADDGVGV